MAGIVLRFALVVSASFSVAMTTLTTSTSTPGPVPAQPSAPPCCGAGYYHGIQQMQQPQTIHPGCGCHGPPQGHCSGCPMMHPGIVTVPVHQPPTQQWMAMPQLLPQMMAAPPQWSQPCPCPGPACPRGTPVAPAEVDSAVPPWRTMREEQKRDRSSGSTGPPKSNATDSTAGNRSWAEGNQTIQLGLRKCKCCGIEAYASKGVCMNVQCAACFI